MNHGREGKKLNKEQLAATEHGRGPLLIIAGAGTGKTTVVTERIKYLVAAGLAKPSQILALTFTDKAAREMEEGVDTVMPYGYTQMWISTFHSFCDRILRLEAIHIGLNPGYNLLTQAETLQFLRQNLFRFQLDYFRPLGNPYKFLEGMLQHFSRLKDEDISASDYLNYAQKQKESKEFSGKEAKKYLELANAYKTYEELKVKEGVADFADLISNTLRLFRERRNILSQYRQQFKYILVDEFQDTNYAQYVLLKLLAPPAANPNLTVVGDDSQSIYKFRGAAISNILQFMDDYPTAKKIILTKNYRSNQAILDSAYRLIKHNDPDTLESKLGISKNLIACRKVKETPPEFFHAERVEDEAEMVAEKIKEMTDRSRTGQKKEGSFYREENQAAEGYLYKDFAILVRANAHAEPFTRALSRAGIPYQFLGPGMLFRQPEIKDLIAYLKVLANFEDSVAMYRLLAMDIFEVNGRDLAAITAYAKKNNLSLFEAAEQAEKIFVSPKTKETVTKLMTMIHRHLGLIKKETAGQILYYFLEDSGLLRKMAEYKTIAEERRAENIARFFNKLRTYEVEHEDSSVFAVADWIDLSLEMGESPLAADIDWAENNTVNILTVHSAKGLEFPVVFLVNLSAGRFPTRERREPIPIPEKLIREILPAGDYHLEEERRLFYVGMTRAKDYLFLSTSDYYGEGKRERKISLFVIEALGEEVLQVAEINREGKEKQLSLFSWKNAANLSEDQLPTQKEGQPAKINYLSYSQIEVYDTCPLKYRYRYLQKIPVAPSAAQSFGDAVHKALRDFGLELKRGNRLSKEQLMDLLAHHWSPVGYASKFHEKKMFARGKEILANFYDQTDFSSRPKELEMNFVIRISPDLKISGKIDRIDEKRRGIEIIDYKTGKEWEQKQVDDSLQMTIYGLAATDKGIYNQKPEEVTMTFYFLETGRKKSTKRTGEELEAAKNELCRKAKEIAESRFKPTPGKWCDFCEFRLICEAWS